MYLEFCIVLSFVINVQSAVLPTNNDDTTVLTTQGHTAKPTQEPGVWHGVVFHMRPYSSEALLILNNRGTCYAMPLTEQDMKDTQHPNTLRVLEGFLLTQVGEHHYSVWSADDLAVRDGYYGVKECTKDVYRVFRI